jgi:putative tricarboxylic transport membrane protein
MENLFLGFITAGSFTNIMWCLLGVLLGTVVGALPGLGPVATISMLLPYTYALSNPVTGIIFLAGIYYGSQYGGSVTAILLKLPGESSSAITTLDGYALTQKGRSGSALTITALSSFIGGTGSIIIIAILAEPLSKLAYLFGPAEYASLMLLGIIATASITQGSLIKGLAMILLGGFLGSIGTNITTGKTRFTADINYLVDGISFTVLAVGVFGLGEILYQLMKKNKTNKSISKIGSLYPTRNEMRQAIAPTLRGTLLGSFIGILPGGVTALSSFLGYSLEKHISKRPEEFGKGSVAGIASPEAANNASAQTNFLPTLILGLPVTPVMVLVFAVLIMNGIQPGPNVIFQNPTLFWGLIASMWIGNCMLLILNIPLVHVWTRILLIPRCYLYPTVITVCLFGIYSINHSYFDLLLLIVFSLLGFFLRFKKFEIVPLVLSFMIVPLLEEYGLRALAISGGDFMVFFNRYISVAFLLISLLLIILNLFGNKVKIIKKK